MSFLDPYLTYAVGVRDAERLEAHRNQKSYSPATTFRIRMDLRKALPNRTDITDRSIAAHLGRLASAPESPVVRVGKGMFGDVFYGLKEGAFAYEQVGCARCHGEGHKLVFMPLTYSIEQVKASGKIIYGSHWAMCPKVHQPIIFGTIKEGDDA